jgi:hypothetical protein
MSARPWVCDILLNGTLVNGKPRSPAAHTNTVAVRTPTAKSESNITQVCERLPKASRCRRARIGPFAVVVTVMRADTLVVTPGTRT